MRPVLLRQGEPGTPQYLGKLKSCDTRILAINNYYGLIRIINGYIDYFYIRIKDLIGLLNSQRMIINLYKSVIIFINLYSYDIFKNFCYLISY